MSDNRRNFIKKTALLGLSGIAAGVFGKEQLQTLSAIGGQQTGDAGKLTLPPLPYAYDALEPFIDKQTMEIHHTKHHQGYVDKLNTVSPKLMDFSADLASNCKKVNAQSEPLFRNNLGGHYNHTFFWTLLKPNPNKKQMAPEGKLAEAINKQFQSFDAFGKEFSEKATKILGSGWCWLIVDENKNLKITTTPNQDNPLMQVAGDKGHPVIGLDVWEHAYYLKYQNKRADYIGNWWNITNWEKANQNFMAA